MRANSVIVLLAIALSILAPFPVHLTIAHGETVIATFDFCHAGSPALSTSNHMPCVSQPIYHPCLPSPVEGAEILGPTLTPFVVTFQEEHPPEI
jgi:hypothetical protein